MEDHIRTRDAFPGLEREKARVFRPAADENELAGPSSHGGGAQTERTPLGDFPAEMVLVLSLIIPQETGFGIAVFSGRLS